MSIYRSPSARHVTIGLTLLRIVLGATFVMHGGQKLFVYGFAGVSGAFAQMGMPMPGLLGPFVGLVELFGGVAIILGLLTRVAAFGLASTMVVAILAVHLKAGFFNPGGFEFPLALLAMAGALSVTGAGAFSLDAIVERRIFGSSSLTELRSLPVSTRKAA